MTEEEIRSFLAGENGGEAEIKKVKFPPLRVEKSVNMVKTGLSHLENIQIELKAELGQASLKVREVLGLTEGSVIKLDKAVGDAVEVIMNQQRFARGEVVIINDSFGVRIASINQAHTLKLTEGLV